MNSMVKAGQTAMEVHCQNVFTNMALIATVKKEMGIFKQHPVTLSTTSQALINPPSL